MQLINLNVDAETNVNWLDNGEPLSAAVLNRPLLEVAGFLNTLSGEVDTLLSTSLITHSDAIDYVVTTAELKKYILVISGTLTANRNLVLPVALNTYIINNNTTGGFSIIVKTPSGTGITIPTATTKHVRSNGTNIVSAINDDIGTGLNVLNTNPTIDGLTVKTGADAGLVLRTLFGATVGAIYSSGVTPSNTNYGLAIDTASAYLNGTTDVFLRTVGSTRLSVNATNINITPITASTSVTTGALTVAGGVGVAGALNVGGAISATGGISGTTGSFTGAVTVPTPTLSTHAANKGYVDALKQGLDIKDSVRVASTANIAVASALINASTIDGVVVATGDRVLLKNQTTASENGIYVVVASGAASRATDADTSAKVTAGMYTYVSEGTASAGTGFVITNADTIALGTTALAFTAFSGAGQVVAGNGLTETGNTLTINTAITADLNSVQTFTNKSISGTQITYIQSGTGAVVRNIQDKSREIVSVKDYGAVGDGVTNDTAAVQAALNFSLRVDLGKGTYLISAPLTVVDGQHIFGTSRTESIIKKGDFVGGAIQGIDVDNVVLEDFKILGVGQFVGTGNKGLNFFKSAQAIIINHTYSNITLEALNDYALYVGTGAFFKYNNVSVRQCAFGMFIDGGDAHTLSSVTVRDVLEGIYINGATTSTLNSCYVEQAGIGIKLNNSNNITLQSCGVEANINRDAGRPGRSYHITGGDGNALIGCLSRQDTIGAAVTNVAQHLLVDGVSTNLAVLSFRKINSGTWPPATSEVDVSAATGAVTFGPHNFDPAKIVGGSKFASIADLNSVQIFTNKSISGNQITSEVATATTATNQSGGTVNATTIAASGLITANGGQIKFPATAVPSADANTLDDYEEYTSPSTACTGALTLAYTYKVTKVGRLVTLHLPAIFGTTTNVTNINLGAALPTKYIPSVLQAFICARIAVSTSLAAPGMVLVDATGQIQLYRDGTAGLGPAWGTLSGTGLSSPISVSWNV